MLTSQTSISNNCEKQEVHVVNSIQPAGIFVAINKNNFKISHVSANCNFVFYKDPQDIINTSLENYFSERSIQKIIYYNDLLRNNSFPTRSITVLEIYNLNKNFEQMYFLIYGTDNEICIECEIGSQFIDAKYKNEELLIEGMIEEITYYNGHRNALASLVCKYIKNLTHFERVYFCEFLEDGHGYVPADFSESPLESLQDHHFPATDVPMVVRSLYVKNRYRMICKASYEAVPIVGLKGKMNLERSLFRNIGSTHLQYLKNMGIQASASFSVIEENKLKGLIGCHAVQGRVIPLFLLPKIQTIVEIFATKLMTYKLNETIVVSQNFILPLIDFANLYSEIDCDLSKLEYEKLCRLKKIFNADFIFYRSNNKLQSNTEIPIELVQYLTSFIDKNISDQEFYVSNRLFDSDPKFDEWKHFASGIILISLEKNHSSFIALLRKEKIQTRTWSGNPESTQVQSDGTLSPRNSFNTWYHQINRMCEPWSHEEISLAQEFRKKLLDIRSGFLTKYSENMAILSEKNKENETLLSEVHHRVKNNLAILCSFFDWKIRESHNQEVINEMREMKSRVTAISTLHEVLYQGGSFGTVNLARYLRSIFSAVYSIVKLQNSETIDFRLNVPGNIIISINDALPIGLITHEFITNSIKHAFLGVKEPILSFEWKYENENTFFILKDNGKGCEDIAIKKGSSLGLELIKLLIGQLDGTMNWEGKNGVELKIQFNKGFS
ncbi:histidine kinase dimerization/phosphoacceptor domain -containing protein [Silvanigrella aquatica]|uniref:histidine kinase n=1 Tax=Silvanigrella aquatica TaxID=1915309 RepID=A0A1L4CYW6_9BACT|nr:histidine kinase dimerization/phosphoacceptor domain -containing protein [Silvanigrella aquatica]APJ03138.1 hypothetical protein AXG55_04145 [Silvanigrella aquatica]